MENTVFIGCRGPKGQSRHILKEYLLAGTSDSCDIQIEGRDICAKHFRIERQANRILIRDLSANSKLMLNSTPILLAPWTEHDQLSLGPYQFYIESETPILHSGLTSRNQNWQMTLNQLPRLALSDHSMLLTGPSGSGKDVLARRVHALSKRYKENFISVNCAAIQESLVESELFGHKRGSFTGANDDRLGAFQSADKGTLFLDEIGDLPLSVQAKLLRALENKEIKSVGSDQNTTIDVRVIAATHKNIESLVAEGRFREDLYYRLNVITVIVPSLKNRIEDLPDLVRTMSTGLRLQLTDSALNVLKNYSWPGNIRELKNFILRASALYPNQLIQPEQILELMTKPKVHSIVSGNALPPGRDFIRQVERGMILDRLVENNWNQRKTARELGIPKSTLNDQIRRYSLKQSVVKEAVPSGWSQSD